MELIDVVDKDGNNTGLVVSREEAQKNNLPHWEVIIFIVNDNEILLQKRSANKKYFPNKWAVCAGLVISGESVDEGAIREIKEEVGIDFSIDDLKVLNKNLNLTRFYYVFCNKREDEFVVQEEELSCVKWFDLDEVINLIKNKDERFIINERIYNELVKLRNILNKNR